MVAKVTTNGMVIIPVAIRKSLGISDGDEVNIKVIGKEIIIEQIKEKIDVQDLKGVLKSSRKVSDEELHTARAKALTKKWNSR